MCVYLNKLQTKIPCLFLLLLQLAEHVRLVAFAKNLSDRNY